MGNSFSIESLSCDQLVQPLLPFLCGKWKYLYNLEDNLEALHKVMQDLNAMRNDLQERVSKEKDRGLQVLQEVNGWILMVEKTEPKANRLLDESVSEIRRLSMYGYCFQNSASTYNYSENVVMMLKKVEALRSEGVFEDVVDRALLPLAIKRPPIQLSVSQEKLLEMAWRRLMDEKVGTLGIFGVCGVGKTTLLTQIKNKFSEAGRDVFDLVIFVVVGSGEVKSIQEGISKRLGLQWGRETKDEKAAHIWTILKKKRFVVLLDDTQGEVDLEKIGLPLPSRENGCKIVFTTCSREACESKWVDDHEVKRLSPDEAWDLFQNTVGENTLRNHPDIPKLASVVASTCRGLPLALDIIGETMARKSTVREWRHMIHVLASSTAKFQDMEDEYLPVLKSVYDNMSGKIRLCFLYCALFPTNYNIKKEDLVNYWIAEGIIAKEDRKTAEAHGCEMIGDLVRMRLLMEDESGYGVKMHGMVREMALWIASDFGSQKEHFVVVAGERIREMPKVNDWGVVRRMSMTSTEIENILDSPRCSELTTLILKENDNLKWISGDFFRWMTSLVLLDLSSNQRLSKLPEDISSLVSLQFLNLSGTEINRLPLGLKELKKLIHLDLDYTSHLKEIEVIASLLNLQVLRLFDSAPMDLSLMESLQRLKSLKELSLTVVEDSVFVRLLSSHRLTSCIRRLRHEYITITGGVIALLNAMFSVRDLEIFKCNIPESTNYWRSTIQRATGLSGNTEMIPQFKNVRTVCLYECNGLRDLTWLLTAPSLDDLTLSKCPEIERVISREKAKDHTCGQPFQNLTRLSLNDLPKLESIYWTPLPFPVLEYIQIGGCPKLRRLPFKSERAKGNQLRLHLDEEWIIEEWEDEATTLRFGGFNNRDLAQMAPEQKIDGLAPEFHPIKTKDGSELKTKESSMYGKKMFQSEKRERNNSIRRAFPGPPNEIERAFPSTRKGTELGKLVLSSGLLHTSWKKISELHKPTYPNQDTALGIKTHKKGKYTLVVFAAPPVSSINDALDSDATLLSRSQDHNPFQFLCSEKISEFSVHTRAFKLFSSAYIELSDLKAELLEANKPVIITGAALGGSVASLFTLWLLETIDSQLKRPLCITFGSPLVGDASLQQILEDSVRNSCFLHVAQPQTRVKGDFKPFGRFLICYDSECICIEDPEAVMELLTGANADPEDYGRILDRLDQSVLSMADSRLMIDDVIDRMKERAEKKKPRFDPFQKWNDMNVAMIYMEWYKKESKKAKMGYYDRFKTKTVSPLDKEIEKQIKRVVEYWKSVVEVVEKKPQSDVSVLKRRFRFAGNNYRLLMEPLEIAKYYHNGGKEYRTTGRSHHFVMLEEWFGKKSDEPVKTTKAEGRDLSDLLMNDSCFWAEVEEAMIVINSLKSHEGMSDEISEQKLVEFEEYVWRMIDKREVSPEIFLEKSSFMRWWKEYEEIKGFNFTPSHLTEFMNTGKYQTYGIAG